MSTDMLKRLADLPPEKRRLLEMKLRTTRGAAAAAAELKPVPRVEGTNEFPLSFTQQRLWLLDRMDPGNAGYNLPLMGRLRGDLDTAVMEAAFNALRARHEALRTVFVERGGQAFQVVHPFSPVPLPVVDLTHLPPDEQAAAVRRISDGEVNTGFDLSTGPLFRAQLLRVAPNEHVITGCIHHIVSDGWSMGIFIRELNALYAAFREGKPDPLPPLALQYPDYAVWQREHLGEAGLRRQLDHWREALAGAPPSLEIPADHPRPPVESHRGDRMWWGMPASVGTPLKELALREETTLFAVLLAAYRAVLGRLAGQDDVVLGTPTAGRTRRELEPLIGFFVNTLPLRTSLAGDPPFRELVRRERETVLDALAHQEVPFERIVEELKLPRDLSRNPLFQATLSLQNTQQVPLSLDSLTIEDDEELRYDAAKFDLGLDVMEEDGVLGLALEWAVDVYSRETAERVARMVRMALERAAVDPDQPLSALLAPDAEERARLETWARGPEVPAAPELLHAAFGRRAAATPNAVCVVAGDRVLTYGEVDARATALARRLVAAGVRPDRAVAILAEHSVDAVVAVLGVLKSGGAFLPLDPASPPARMLQALEDGGAVAVVAQPHLAGKLPDTGLPLLRTDAGDADPGEVTFPAADPDTLAYVLFTSGSTGRPKPVGVAHGPASLHIAGAVALYGMTAEDRLLSFSALTFDPWLEQLFTAFHVGASLAMRDPQPWSPAELAREARRMEVTFAFLPTAYWHQVTADAPAAAALRRQVR
ncbi:MAG TPA: condensation domain-containing protein, partial [Longimicrobium sp.]|nr:condensation domain-containing protein [Longimicrobium sp.]